MVDLHQWAGGADRIAVVDTETTGLCNSDRVVEIAIITLTLDGEIVDEWDTLVQPLRDVSASHIHGITASMCSGAPTFQDIAGDVAVRLHGACLAAHNLPFDTRMIGLEFERLDGVLNVPAGLDTLRATGARLQEACSSFGIQLDGAHRALNDARATAALLLAAVDYCDEGGVASAPTNFARTGRALRREDAGPVVLPEPPLIAYLASRLPHVGVEAHILAYLELINRAVVDLHLDTEERRQLAALATRGGLSDADVKQAHRRFVNELIDQAVADRIVTDDEYDALVRVASALDVDQRVVEDRIASYRSSTTTRFRIERGMSVVVTGDHPAYERWELFDLLERHGFVVQTGVSKKTALLAAVDPTTKSGKATKARKYGLPVVSVDDLLEAIVTGQPIGATTETTSLKVVTCPDCWATRTVPATTAARASKRCDECVSPVPPPSVPPWPAPTGTGESGPRLMEPRRYVGGGQTFIV